MVKQRSGNFLGGFAVSSFLLIGILLLSGCSQVLTSTSLIPSISSVSGGTVTNKSSDQTTTHISTPTPNYTVNSPADYYVAVQEKKLQLEAHFPLLPSVQASTSQPSLDSETQIQDHPDTGPVPIPDPPGTPIHPFYEAAGTPPSAPGLAMRHRTFTAEPKKIAYLTIDDGPYPETTPKILDILQNEKVHATFFVIGRQAEHYPELLKAEYEKGNAIGNHTYSHDYKVIYPGPSSFLADIKKNEEIIFKTIGIRPAIIRAPGGTQGHFHINYYNAIDAAGYMVYDWNVSTGDASATSVSADELVRNVINESAGKSRIIILMHDVVTKKTTVEALPRIIEYLKSQGYSFGVLNSHVPPILFPGGFMS